MLVTYLSLLMIFNKLYRKFLSSHFDKNYLTLYIWIYVDYKLTLHLKVILKMRKKEQLNSIIEICPVRNVVARFGNKWALLVILVLSENEPIRYNEL